MKNFFRAVNEGRYALYFVGACIAAIFILHSLCVEKSGGI